MTTFDTSDFGSALYSRLNTGTAVTALLSGTTAIYYQIAPEGADMPYIVWNYNAVNDRTESNHKTIDVLANIRAYSGTANYSGSIAKQVDIRINTPIDLSGFVNFWVAREDYIDTVELGPDGKAIYGANGVYRYQYDAGSRDTVPPGTLTETHVTLAERNALDAAENPSTANPVMTDSAVDSLIATHLLLTASASQAGHLSAADWTTFNGKQSALGPGTASHVARWSGTSTIDNSVIQDTGTGIIGINTSPVTGVNLCIDGLTSSGVYLRCRTNVDLDVFSVINISEINAYITVLGITQLQTIIISGKSYAYFGSSADYTVLGSNLHPVAIGGAYSVLSANSGCVIAYAADRQQLLITGHTTQAVATPIAQVTRADVVAGISAMLGLTALGSGANGDGGSIMMNGKSSTAEAQSMAAIKWLWNSSVDLSRKADLVVTAWDTAEREILRGRGGGSAPMIGFLGAAPVAQQTGCAVPTDLASCIAAITALRAVLNNYGLTTVV